METENFNNNDSKESEKWILNESLMHVCFCVNSSKHAKKLSIFDLFLIISNITKIRYKYALQICCVKLSNVIS